MANRKREDELQEDRASYGGSAFDQKYFTDDELRGAAEARAAAERGETDWGSAHDYVEGIRAQYGYTGGKDGSEYQRTAGAGATDYYSLPAKTTQYGDTIRALVEKYMGRKPFSYNAEDDPIYRQYAKSYGDAGRRAMQDTLAQVSARTGGLASSYATTASQQAYERYMAQLADKVPELYKLAHDMYLSEGDQMRDDIGLLRGLDSDEYGRTVDDWSRRYQLGRDAASDARYADETAYSRGRDALSDQRYADELAYGREQDAIAQRSSALSTIMGMIQSGMTLDSVPSYLLDQAGLTGDQYGSMSRDAAAQLAAQAAMKSSGGSSRRSSSGSESAKPKLTAAQVRSAIKDGIVSDEVMSAYEYWFGEPYEAPFEGKNLGNTATSSSLGFDPDEGLFYWNGNTYSDKNKLMDDINMAADRGELTDDDLDRIIRAAQAWGITF